MSGRRSTANRRLPVSAIAPGVQRWRVVLPPEVAGPIEVFVNGVPQREGEDYDREGAQLAFRRPLAREGRLGFWRWLSLFLGVAGTYRQNDQVDVVFEAGGRRVVATGLEVVAPDGTPAESA